MTETRPALLVEELLKDRLLMRGTRAKGHDVRSERKDDRLEAVNANLTRVSTERMDPGSEPHAEADPKDKEVLSFGEVVVDARKNGVLAIAEEKIPGEPCPKDKVFLATLANALITGCSKELGIVARVKDE